MAWRIQPMTFNTRRSAERTMNPPTSAITIPMINQNIIIPPTFKRFHTAKVEGINYLNPVSLSGKLESPVRFSRHSWIKQQNKQK